VAHSHVAEQSVKTWLWTECRMTLMLTWNQQFSQIVCCHRGDEVLDVDGKVALILRVYT